MDIRFVDYDRVYLEKSWEWLNDAEIKRLTMTPKFSKESQEIWFMSLNLRSDYFVWGIEVDRQPIGVMGIKNIDYAEGCGEYFGYIGEKQYWSKGIGRLMIQKAKEVVKKMKLKNVILKVSSDNIRAYSLYRKEGFHELGNENKTIIMEYSL